jgi:hypothetical protein
VVTVPDRARPARLRRQPGRLRRGVVEMLAVPAIGGVAAAALAIGQLRVDELWRWVIAGCFTVPALVAQVRYTARHHDDRWANALTLLMAGTAVMMAVAWAAGLAAAFTTAFVWEFFHNEGVMNQAVATVVVASALLSTVVTGWRWLAPSTDPS